jgi:transcriptional regulator with PAS, ATPase and Fis domain
VDGLGDASITIRQEGNQGTARETVPVLLVVGDARRGGASDRPRLLLLPPSLEIGRVRDESVDAEGGRLGLPDKLLSRVHLRIERVPGGCDVEDPGSLNGTFVDGRRLVGRQRLSDGNLLLFGGHAAVFRRVSEETLAAISEDLAGPFGPVATTSPTLANTIWRLRRLAKSGSGVFITGETGVGKEVYARAVHRASKRAGRMVAVNCAAIPAELAESELFGYTRGAHSTASEAKTGLIEAADGGTLFLDEIGDMNPRLQAKLLRFLQEKTFERVGETRTRKADVRVVAATNRDLEADVKSGHFREDLFFRLNVIEVAVPPLRDRQEDIVPLARRFLAFFARAVGRTQPTFSPAAEAALAAYEWPGNVRELRNAIERAVILWPSAIIEPQAFPERIAETAGRGPLLAVGGDVSVEDLERVHISAVVARCRTMDEAAKILGIDVSTLWRKRKRYEEDTNR